MGGARVWVRERGGAEARREAGGGRTREPQFRPRARKRVSEETTTLPRTLFTLSLSPPSLFSALLPSRHHHRHARLRHCRLPRPGRLGECGKWGARASASQLGRERALAPAPLLPSPPVPRRSPLATRVSFFGVLHACATMGTRESGARGGGRGLLFRAPRNVARETQRAPAVGEVGWGLAPQLPLLCTPCIEARRLGWPAGGERARGAGGWAANTPPCSDASAGEHLLSRPPLPPPPRPIPRVALQTGRQHSHLEDREASCVVS